MILHRYHNFKIVENLNFEGKKFVHTFDNPEDFDDDVVKVLKSPSLIEYNLEEGAHFLHSVVNKGKTYNVYLATKNNALWILTNDDKGENEEFNFIDDDQDFNRPYLIIEIASIKDQTQTFILRPDNLSFEKRDTPTDIFEDTADENIFELFEEWPAEVMASLTDYAFDRLHVKTYNDEIKYTKDTVVLNLQEGAGSMATAFNDADTVKVILNHDGHEYFNYDYTDFESHSTEAFEMLDVDNVELVATEYNITSATDFTTLLAEDDDTAKSLQMRLLKAYTKAQEYADLEDCRDHIIKNIETSLNCHFIDGLCVFTHANFGKFVPRMSIAGTGIEDIFKKGDVDFTFHDTYYSSIDETVFNEEFTNEE